MPLVLVHNDVVTNPAHAWDDVEGVRYHYPAKYQGLISTGEPFVYYRGVHRSDGKRGQAEYVGAGRIGAIWADPERATGRRKAWYCAIDDYVRFAEPVPAKVDDVTLETIPRNLWRDGVRSLDPAVHARIIRQAQRQPPLEVNAPSPGAVTVRPSDMLIVPPTPGDTRASGSRPTFRRSRGAKAIGDWAEQIVLRHLRDQGSGLTELVHRAAIGETPGWDIDFRNAEGSLQRVEVKGTVGGGFTGFDLTAGELRAARTYGDAYWLYLVAGCLTEAPRVQAVPNPASRIDSGAWSATPAVYSVRFRTAS